MRARAGIRLTIIAPVYFLACGFALTSAQSPAPGQVPSAQVVPGQTTADAATTEPTATSPRDPKQPVRRVVRGRVISVDNQPITDANVVFQVPNGGNFGMVLTRTDDSGRFEVGVAPGAYAVSADKTGFLRGYAGSQSLVIPDADANDGGAVPSQTLPLPDINIVLTRGGAIRGRVTDERGYPLPNVRIVATGSREVDCAARSIAAGPSQVGALLLPSSAAQGSVGVTTTNEKGEYRVAGLMPGSYYICASSDERWPAAVGTAAVRSYPTTYFPGVAAADATPVAVEIEQLRDGVDFALRPVTSAAR